MRLQRIHQAIPPLEDAKTDYEIFCELGEKLNTKNFPHNLNEAQQKLSDAYHQLKGIAEDEFPEWGIEL